MSLSGKITVCVMGWSTILAASAFAADAPAVPAAKPAAAKPKAKVKAIRKDPPIMLGTQAYTFRLFTLFEAIDKAQKLGLNYMEGFPGQKLSKETGDVKFDTNLSPEMIAKLKEHLASRDVQLKGLGVVSFGKDEAECRKLFEFARELGVVTITAEPAEDVLPMIDKLANEYKINVAIHNHPKPSHYWNPDTVLNAIKDLSPRMGACADTGHWVRSGLDPVESLKKLKGRIHWLHLKDLNQKSPDAHDVVWGTGVCNAKQLLTELYRQGFKGGVMVEYEHNWENSSAEIAQCVKFYRATMKELRGQAKQSKPK